MNAKLLKILLLLPFKFAALLCRLLVKMVVDLVKNVRTVCRYRPWYSWPGLTLTLCTAFVVGMFAFLVFPFFRFTWLGRKLNAWSDGRSQRRLEKIRAAVGSKQN